MYLGIVKGKPKPSTGVLRVSVPSLYGDTMHSARPKKPYLGLYIPYKLGDIVVIEIIDNMLYYSDKVYRVGEYETENVPEDSYSFVTPYGYIAFTENGVEIKHKKGGTITLTDEMDVNTTLRSKDVKIPTQDLSFVKWR